MDDEVKLYRGMDGNPVKNPIAVCHYYKHRGYMTENMVKRHGCLQKNCRRLQRIDSPFWEERKQRKLNAKAAKQKLYEKCITQNSRETP